MHTRPADRSRRRTTPRPYAARRAQSAALVALGALVLAGCGSTDGEADPTQTGTPTQSRTETAVPQPSDPVAAAVENLAERLEVPQKDVEVVGTEEVTWNDGSLGCAQKGMSYTQALVPGLRITLRVDGTEHAYHQARGKTPFLCEKPTQ